MTGVVQWDNGENTLCKAASGKWVFPFCQALSWLFGVLWLPHLKCDATAFMLHKPGGRCSHCHPGEWRALVLCSCKLCIGSGWPWVYNPLGLEGGSMVCPVAKTWMEPQIFYLLAVRSGAYHLHFLSLRVFILKIVLITTPPCVVWIMKSDNVCKALCSAW